MKGDSAEESLPDARIKHVQTVENKQKMIRDPLFCTMKNSFADENEDVNQAFLQVKGEELDTLVAQNIDTARFWLHEIRLKEVSVSGFTHKLWGYLQQQEAEGTKDTNQSMLKEKKTTTAVMETATTKGEFRRFSKFVQHTLSERKTALREDDGVLVVNLGSLTSFLHQEWRRSQKLCSPTESNPKMGVDPRRLDMIIHSGWEEWERLSTIVEKLPLNEGKEPMDYYYSGIIYWKDGDSLSARSDFLTYHANLLDCSSLPVLFHEKFLVPWEDFHLYFLAEMNYDPDMHPKIWIEWVQKYQQIANQALTPPLDQSFPLEYYIRGQRAFQAKRWQEAKKYFLQYKEAMESGQRPIKLARKDSHLHYLAKSAWALNERDEALVWIQKGEEWMKICREQKKREVKCGPLKDATMLDAVIRRDCILEKGECIFVSDLELVSDHTVKRLVLRRNNQIAWIPKELLAFV
jgi:hypothetical protein